MVGTQAFDDDQHEVGTGRRRRGGNVPGRGRERGGQAGRPPDLPGPPPAGGGASAHGSSGSRDSSVAAALAAAGVPG